MPDFEVENHGSLFLVRALNQEAFEHLSGNVSDEAQWMGQAVAVEPHYVRDLVEALRDNGWNV